MAVIVVVQSPSCVRIFVASWTAAAQASTSLTISQSLLKFMSIASAMLSITDGHQPSHPLMSSSSSVLNVSQHQGLFQWWVSYSHQITKILEFQLQHQSFQLVFRVISLKIDWFDFPVLKGTLQNLLQHHNLKASNMTNIKYLNFTGYTVNM